VVSRNVRTCLVAFVFAVSTCVTAAAQARATLRGSVNDEIGAVIVGATVTLTDSSGSRKIATTGNDGAFSFTGLAPGKYLVHAIAGGFAQSDDDEVDITMVPRDPTVITLKVAEIQSEVKVESKPEPASSTSSDLATCTIVLRAVFDKDGKVTHISFVEAKPGEPNGCSDEEVKTFKKESIDAARKIKFTPAMKDGHPVSMWMQLEYNFSLDPTKKK